jgi:hypothetical protein
VPESVVRVAKLGEKQFALCVEHRTWGSTRNLFSRWLRGDLLALVVNDAIAGIADVCGDAYTSNDMIWED